MDLTKEVILDREYLEKKIEKLGGFQEKDRRQTKTTCSEERENEYNERML